MLTIQEVIHHIQQAELKRDFRHEKRIKNKNTGWQKIPGSMENVFGDRYLEEQDWKI